MLSNIVYSINAVMPMFLLVIVGAMLNKCKKVNKEFTVVADWLVFKVALPIMLFLEIASSEFTYMCIMVIY